MNPRVRLAAALLALFTFSLYFVESVWAATCVPGAHGEMIMVADADADGHSGHGGMSHGERSSPERSDPSERDSRHCPMAATGVGSSCVAASLPAPTHDLQAAAARGTSLVPAPDTTRDRLLVAPHFRPPRA